MPLLPGGPWHPSLVAAMAAHVLWWIPVLMSGVLWIFLPRDGFWCWWPVLSVFGSSWASLWAIHESGCRSLSEPSLVSISYTPHLTHNVLINVPPKPRRLSKRRCNLCNIFPSLKLTSRPASASWRFFKWDQVFSKFREADMHKIKSACLAAQGPGFHLGFISYCKHGMLAHI